MDKLIILDKFFKNKKNEEISITDIIDVLLKSENSENYIYTLAEAHAIDLIAQTIARCEIQTFEKIDGKIQNHKGDLYWRLNLQPNYNETGTAFFYKLVTKLLINKEALIIINKDINNSKLLYVADEFTPSSAILYEKIFSNVQISDNSGNTLPLTKIYNSENSIYYSLKNTNLNTAKADFKANSKKILNTISKSFIKSNTPKWKLKFPGQQPTMIDKETGKPVSYEEYKQKITEGLLSEEEAIVLLSEIFNLENLNKDNKQSLNDYKDGTKEICDNVAMLWNIPLDIFYGTKTEKSTGNNDFITFGVSTYFKLLEDGFNISLIGKRDYLKGEYAKFNTNNLNHRDIIDSANGIDKLTADGFSRNEINELLGLPRIDESWADEHNITKNYANVKGGANENGE